MKNFDHKFSEKLYNHKTSPPADLWEKLDGSLEAERNQKKRFLYWRVAAAVTFLLLTTGVVWYNIDRTISIENTVVADYEEEPVQELAPEKPNELAYEQQTGSSVNVTQEQKPVAVDPPPVVEREQKSFSPASNPNDRLTAGEKVNPTSDQAATDARIKVGLLEPVKPSLLAVERHESDYTASLPITNAPVTIIFKPGSKADKLPEMNKPLELLADLKNSSFSFSEIRSAKSELLAKVFDKLDNEFSR